MTRTATRAVTQVSCESLQTPRGIVSVINDGASSVSLAVSFSEDGDHIIAATHIKNTSDEPLMFDSDIWGAAHFSKKESAGTVAGPSSPKLRSRRAISLGDKIRSRGRQLC